MEKVRYDGAYMFKYSPREGTKAYKMEDDVPEETKTKRLSEIIDLQQTISYDINQKMIGSDEVVLVEGLSKKSDQFWAGRTDTNKIVIFPVNDEIKVGDYVKVKLNRATSGTLFGDVVEIISPIGENVSLTA
jgi:tRNA-2-methylthio-N6-dimethylallyladenosine synthase